MATIIEHRETGKQYVLLGTGFGLYESKKPHWLLGDVGSEINNGRVEAVFCCDGNGKVEWFPAKQIRVVSVDGQAPDSLL